MSGIGKFLKVTAWTAALLVAGAGIAWAEVAAEGAAEGAEPAEETIASQLEFAADATFVNKYVWRGILFTDGPVFQPSATLAYKGASINIWGNLDLDNVNGLAGEFNEFDLTLDYTHGFDELSVSGGMIYYDFPNTGFDGTLELYVGASLDILLQPTLFVYFDVAEAQAIYGTFDLAHTADLPDLSDDIQWDLDLSAGVGLGSKKYVDFYFGDRSPAFTNFHAEAALPVTFFEHFSVTPFVGVTMLLDNTLRQGATDADNFLVGGTLACSF